MESVSDDIRVSPTKITVTEDHGMSRGISLYSCKLTLGWFIHLFSSFLKSSRIVVDISRKNL
jgi:hypothetical protein